jgi:hypothetical protein
MTDPVSPIGGPRRVARQAPGDEPAAAGDGEAEDMALPVPIEPPPPKPAQRTRRVSQATFAAHLLGEGQRRGLRGGPETLDEARATYLKTEWSGPANRRLAAGKITKIEI